VRDGRDALENELSARLAAVATLIDSAGEAGEDSAVAEAPISSAHSACRSRASYSTAGETYLRATTAACRTSLSPIVERLISIVERLMGDKDRGMVCARHTSHSVQRSAYVRCTHHGATREANALLSFRRAAR